MVMGVHAMNQGKRKAAVEWILATMVCGAAFVVLHMTEWMNLINHEHVTPVRQPLGRSRCSAARSSAITGLHMTHVAIGVIYLGIIALGWCAASSSPKTWRSAGSTGTSSIWSGCSFSRWSI